MAGYLSFAALALALGIKHSYDADHLIAVSNILKNTTSIRNAISVGLSWAAGHMMTAAIITIILYVFRESFLKSLLSHFEIIAGIILIVLGAVSLAESLTAHSHLHKHGSILHSHFHIHSKSRGHDVSRSHNARSHSHKHIFGIGIIQGLASNDELLLLFMASLGVTTLGGIIIGIGIFSIGVVIGMVLFSCLFSYTVSKPKSDFLHKAASFAIGSASIVYGLVMVL